MDWNIPSESLILDKLDELHQAISNFPESKLVPVWRHAINALISSGDTLRIMFHQHSAHNYPHDIVEK